MDLLLVTGGIYFFQGKQSSTFLTTDAKRGEHFKNLIIIEITLRAEYVLQNTNIQQMLVGNMR